MGGYFSVCVVFQIQFTLVWSKILNSKRTNITLLMASSQFNQPLEICKSSFFGRFFWFGGVFLLFWGFFPDGQLGNRRFSFDGFELVVYNWLAKSLLYSL